MKLRFFVQFMEGSFMGLSKKNREGLLAMGLDPDKGFMDGDEFIRKWDKIFAQREKEQKAKEASNASVSKKKRV